MASILYTPVWYIAENWNSTTESEISVVPFLVAEGIPGPLTVSLPVISVKVILFLNQSKSKWWNSQKKFKSKDEQTTRLFSAKCKILFAVSCSSELPHQEHNLIDLDLVIKMKIQLKYICFITILRQFKRTPPHYKILGMPIGKELQLSI